MPWVPWPPSRDAMPVISMKVSVAGFPSKNGKIILVISVEGAIPKIYSRKELSMNFLILVFDGAKTPITYTD